MLEKNAQPVSPKTMDMMGGGGMGGSVDPEQGFVQTFADLAMQTFGGKFPQIMEKVVTFKTLDSNLEEGSAVGAFILDLNGTEAYVPAIMSDGDLKPLEVVYAKEQDKFVPLTPEWIEQIQLGGTDNAQKIGEPVNNPKTLVRNVDLRNVTFPPLTGRYSFASHTGAEVAAPGILANAEESVKQAFREKMEKTAKFVELAWDVYPVQVMTDALRMSMKTAQEENTGSEVSILLANDTAEAFREAFGDTAGEAYGKALRDGAAIRDARPNEGLNKAVHVEVEQRFTTANEDGLCKFILADGTVKNGLVIQNPISLLASRIPYDRSLKGKAAPNMDNGAARRESGKVTPDRPCDALIIFEDGSYVERPRAKPLASVKITPADLDHSSKLYKAVFDPDRKPLTHMKGKGVFIRRSSERYDAFDPVTVERVSSDSDGVRRIRLDTFAGVNELVTDSKSVLRQPVVPRDSSIGYLPDDFCFIPLGERIDSNRLIYDPDILCRVYEMAFRREGAAPIHIKSADAHGAVIDGTRYHLHGALDFLTDDHRLHGDDAIDLLKEARERGAPFTVHIAPQAALVKVAQAMMGPPPMDPSMMGGAPPMDPAMLGGPPPPAGEAPGPAGGAPPEEPPSEAEMMEPGLMAPPMPPLGPPPPTGIDIAIEEAQDQLRGQASALSQAHQAIKTQIETLDAVRGRATELDMGDAPMMPEPPVPVVMPPVELGGEPMAPGTQMEPGSSPLPPGIAGGPEPLMNGEVTPEGLGQVADQSFDASVIADLAQNDSVADAVATHLPTLEKALDNASRVLLTLWSQEGKVKTQIGDDSYAELEKTLRTVIKNMGSLLQILSQRATLVGSPDDQGRDDL